MTSGVRSAIPGKRMLYAVFRRPDEPWADRRTLVCLKDGTALCWGLVSVSVSVPQIVMPYKRMSEEARLKKKKENNDRAAVHGLLMGFRDLQLCDQMEEATAPKRPGTEDFTN